MTVQPTRDQLRALAGRASRGPWIANNGHVSAAEGRDGIAGNCMDVDAEFIAASRQAVPALLDMLDQAEARIKAVRALASEEDEYGDWVATRDAVLRALDGDR